MQELLRDLVEIQSGTGNKAGVDTLVRHLDAYLKEHGLLTTIVGQDCAGDILIADMPGAAQAEKRILLSGHMDTVFPADTAFRHLTCEGDIARGPGTCDMKGGLVVGIFAMLALKELGFAHLPVRFLFSPDEERSSRTMRAFLKNEARTAAFALVFEMAGPENELVRTRKGKIALKVHIRGKAGHAAFVTHDKISALLDAARKVIRLEELPALAAASGGNSLSVNVGRLQSGTAMNVIPEEAVLEVEARCHDAALLARTEQAMTDILLQPQVPGTVSTLFERVENPPLEVGSTEELYGIAASVAAELGQTVGEDFRAGSSEACYLAAEGLPVLDGFGPLGGKDHSTEEYLLLSSLPERAALTAGTIVKAWDRYTQGGLRPFQASHEGGIHGNHH